MKLKGFSTKFGRKQERAIAALLTEDTQADAAKTCHISEATLWRWQQNPEFAALFKKKKSELLETVTAKLRRHASEAADTLAALASNVENQAAARVSACRAIIEFHLRAHELEDLVERLAALEQAIEGKGK